MQGIPQKETLQMLSMLAEAAKTNDFANDSLRKSKKLWKQLIVEANAQLGLVQLPAKVFESYRELIRQTVHREMQEKEFGGALPKKAIKYKRISAKN